jgi:hypothetical protein
MGRRAAGDRPLTDAEKQARLRAREATELARLRAAAATPPRSPDSDAALQAAARELARQQRRVGELEAENEALRAAAADRRLRRGTGCGFCLKTKDEVPLLIGDRPSFICNECIARCADLMTKWELARTSRAIDNPDHDTAPRVL